ncbi:MAG: MarR family winged helix-turn-helix transcriptional regulator [Candidatus Dojkabacteria bacterium]
MDRQEQVQTIFERIESIFKSMHGGRHLGMHEGMEAHRNMRRSLREEGRKRPFAELNLSRKQIIFLFLIAKSKDGVTSKDLSIFLFISPGAVTQFIDRLIEMNLVKREEDPADRRSIKITLTDYAKSKFNEFRKGYVTSITPFFDKLSDEELIQLTGLLNKLALPDNIKAE